MSSMGRTRSRSGSLNIMTQMKTKKSTKPGNTPQLSRLLLPALLLPAAGVFVAFGLLPDLFEVRKHKEILAALYEEVNMEYVDEVSPSELMRTGVDAMLSSLDPYTVYFSESEVGDARMESTESYGGIGAGLLPRDGQVALGQLHEGGAAQAAGLLPGDIIVSINGRSALGRTADEIAAFLNGQARAAIRLTVNRNGQQLEKTLSRTETSRSNLVWHGMLDANTGYIKIGQFGPRTADEFRQALLELREKGLENMVIDLRDNPGGILQEAVALCNLFIEKGQLIVSTKGKNPANDRSFPTLTEALDTSLPLTVLVTSRSASASEIVAGAFKDMEIGRATCRDGVCQDV